MHKNSINTNDEITNEQITNEQTTNKSLVNSILYDIWVLPKWKDQVQFINNIVDNINNNSLLLLRTASRSMETMETDRKDKFYYLIGLLLDKIEINNQNIKEILSYAGPSTISYYWKIIIKKINISKINNNNVNDLEQFPVKQSSTKQSPIKQPPIKQSFMVEYVAYCPSHILENFEEIELDLGLIKEILKKDDVPYTNRGWLSKKMRKILNE